MMKYNLLREPNNILVYRPNYKGADELKEKRCGNTIVWTIGPNCYINWLDLTSTISRFLIDPERTNIAIRFYLDRVHFRIKDKPKLNVTL